MRHPLVSLRALIAADALATIPLILSGVVLVLSTYATVKAKRNEGASGRIDLLTVSQLSMKEALERADAERERASAEADRLRAQIDKMRNDHDLDRVQWQARFDAQDLEMEAVRSDAASLRVQIKACRESLELIVHPHEEPK